MGTGKLPVLRATDCRPNVKALVGTQTLKPGATQTRTLPAPW